MFDTLYVQGYTAALQDVLIQFDSIQNDLKNHNRKQNYKTYRAIVEYMLQNRAVLREEPYSFIRCNNSVKGGYELYVER